MVPTKAWLKLLADSNSCELEEVDITDFSSSLAITLTLPEAASADEEVEVRPAIRAVD